MSHYSKAFLDEHEPDIIIHKASKKYFNEIGMKKLPTAAGQGDGAIHSYAEEKHTDYDRMERHHMDGHGGESSRS